VSFVITLEPVSELTIRPAVDAINSFEFMVEPVLLLRVDWSPSPPVPEHYFVLRAPFLERPWDEFNLSWSYCKNVLINIGGFVPLGFFFCAYFASVRRFDQAALTTIVLVGVVSLTIEVLQAFLPTRDSGMTDIITNTLGTGIRTALYSSTSVQAIFATVGLGGLYQPVFRDRSASLSGYLQ
jgi:hypothetical protein